MEKQNTYDVDRAYRAFKRVRNRLRKHYVGEIVFRCMMDLNRPDAGSIDRIVNYQPWVLLLLIKWSILYCDSDQTSKEKRGLTENDYHVLLRYMHDMGKEIRMPDEYINPLLFFRNIAYQQLWFQDSLMPFNLARQGVFFRELEQNNYFKVTFLDKNSITIEEFIHLAVVLMGSFACLPQPIITEQTFCNSARGIKQETVRTFLTMLSNDIQSLNDYLKHASLPGLSKAHEYYEQTPLKRFPLLRFSDKYLIFSQTVLFYGLQTYIFDLLRKSDPNEFMNRFGHVFERYVERGLQYAGIKYINETKIREVVSEKCKVVDFYFVDQGINIFVEAKGIEIPDIGMLTHEPEKILHFVKNTIIKAIIQAHETWNMLQTKSNAEELEIAHGLPFLIVVTFKDIYIGNGTNFMSAIAPGFLDVLVNRFGREGIIPPERIYIINVNDFDQLVQAAKNGHPISTVLLQAMKDDTQQQSRKFFFSQHIDRIIPNSGFPEYLRYEWDEIRKRIQLLWDDPVKIVK